MTPAEVRAARQALGMTQTELATALRLASDGRRTIRHWETDGGKFSISGPASVALELMLEIEKLREIARGLSRPDVSAEKGE